MKKQFNGAQRDGILEILPSLRNAAWKLWDPARLLQWGNWNEGSEATEYDEYLLSVSQMLSEGETRDSCGAYLQNIESHHIGMGSRPDALQRASALVDEIKQILKRQGGA